MQHFLSSYYTSCHNILEKLSFLDTFMMTMKQINTGRQEQRQKGGTTDDTEMKTLYPLNSIQICGNLPLEFML